MKISGKIIEPSGCSVRDHERRTARAIADTGLTVEFVPEPTKEFTKSADILIDGVGWEIKSPTTDKLSQIEKNLKKASKQSPNIIVDSQRIRFLPDKKIQDFLVEKLKKQTVIKRMIFVNRKREVIDINLLV